MIVTFVLVFILLILFIAIISLVLFIYSPHENKSLVYPNNEVSDEFVPPPPQLPPELHRMFQNLVPSDYSSNNVYDDDNRPSD